MSSKNNILELERFEANSFAGISSSNPIVIDFTSKRKNQGVVEFLGDQGTRKSSTLMGILYAMGSTFSIEKKRLLNSKDGVIDVTLDFSHDGYKYRVIGKSDRIELKKLTESGKWAKPEDGSPVELLRKMFGPVGLSPFNVREMKPKQQIEYFRNMFGTGDDASKRMTKLEEEIEKVFSNRRETNREVKALSNALEIEPLFQNYEKSQERFAKPVNAEKEKKAYEEMSKQNADYSRYKDNLDMLKVEHKTLSDEIASLERRLKEAKKEAEETAQRIANGDKWMEDNKNIPEQFEAASKQWINLANTLADYEKWKAILRKEKELNEKQELAITQTGELDTLREKLMKETKKCLPDVDGLEIKLATGIDKADQPEGAYFRGQPIHELSQSEYEGMWAEILIAAGMNFLFFENMNNFGSVTIGLLNELAKQGVLIFGTRTDPKVKEIDIHFKAKVDG